MEYDSKTQKKYISKIYGRRLDMIYDTVGNPVFPMVLARVLKNYEGIVQWQFIQKSQNAYKLKINKDQDLNESQILQGLREYFGDDATITIVYVDDIPVLKSGKRKSVINEYN
ncbi:MAG: hypothetical protein SNI42_06760 [Rikenellaceae bacterium]